MTGLRNLTGYTGIPAIINNIPKLLMEIPLMSKKRVQYVNLIAGLILLTVSVIESFEETDEAGFELHHGMIIFALAHIIRVLSDLMESGHKVVHHTKAARQS